MDSIDNPRQEAADAISRRPTPKSLFTVSGMLATFVRGELVATINSVNSALHMSMTDITLLMVQKATEEDGVLVKLVEQIGDHNNLTLARYQRVISVGLFLLALRLVSKG